jgi:hypothetical protein
MGLGQGRSIDTASGWKNHYLRMRRWRDRSLAALDHRIDGDLHEAVDFVLAYFVWCHSLREWLIKSKSIAEETLDSQLQKHSDWKICRDIANRSRHFDLQKNPADKHWSILREYDVFAELDPKMQKTRLFLIFGDEKIDVAALISSTFRMWQRILESNGLRA